MAAAASNELLSIKTVAGSPHLTSLPSSYIFTRIPDEPSISESEISIPIIDYSLLTSGIPNQRSKIINDLRNACQEWGFFTVINHGVPDDQIKGMMEACRDFFNLTEEEKREYEGKHVLDPIRCGTSFNASVDRVLFWRDFLKVFIHPQFHSPIKPAGFSELSLEYCKRIRIVARELLEGISESLGLEACHMNQSMNFESGFQILIANLYPPCPQPELAMGMPPHSDHGLLTLLTQNGISGLQIQHNGKWVNVNAIPNSFLVNIGDHIEILSNGRYKSVIHRAVVNNRSTRISLAIAHGPSLDTMVGPEPQLIKGESYSPAYIEMKYKDYLELQQSNVLDGKTCLDRVRV